MRHRCCHAKTPYPHPILTQKTGICTCMKTQLLCVIGADQLQGQAKIVSRRKQSGRLFKQSGNIQVDDPKDLFRRGGPWGKLGSEIHMGTQVPNVTSSNIGGWHREAVAIIRKTSKPYFTLPLPCFIDWKLYSYVRKQKPTYGSKRKQTYWRRYRQTNRRAFSKYSWGKSRPSEPAFKAGPVSRMMK